MQLDQALKLLEEQNPTQTVIAGSYAAYQAIQAGLLEVPYNPNFEDIDIFRAVEGSVPPLGPEWESLRQGITTEYPTGFNVYQTTHYGYTVQLVLSWNNTNLLNFDIPQHRVMLTLQPLEQLKFVQPWPTKQLDKIRYLGRITDAYAYDIGFSAYWIKDTCASEFTTNTKRIAKCLKRGYPVAPELALWAYAGQWYIYGLKQRHTVYLNFASDKSTFIADKSVISTTWEDSVLYALANLNLEEETV